MISWWGFKDKYYYPTRQFLKNVWLFRKELSNFYAWNYNLGLFRRSIELNRECILDGNEVESSRHKKIAKMERAIYLLKRFEEDDFIELAEQELGYGMNHGNIWFEPCEDREGFSTMEDDLTQEEKDKNSKLIYRSRDIQNELWKELWSIIQGQDYSTFKPNEQMEWDEQFDGSGLLSWWD